MRPTDRVQESNLLVIYFFPNFVRKTRFLNGCVVDIVWKYTSDIAVIHYSFMLNVTVKCIKMCLTNKLRAHITVAHIM